MRTMSLAVARTPYWLAIGLSLALPGCPLSDHYYIDSSESSNLGGRSGVGGADAGVSAGRSSTGGSSTAGSSTGDSGSGGTGVAGTSGIATCGTVQCSDTDTCCNSVCVDLSSDPSNCGACTTLCANGQACVSGICTSGWSRIATAPSSFVAREMPAYVGFGQKLFIFGGADINGNPLGDGAIYDATTNRWTLVSINGNAPSPRRLATAVWTGSLIVVCGGRVGSTDTGVIGCASYDPTLDQWSAVTNEIASRVAPVGVASASQAAFWGGWGTASTWLSGAERIDMTTNAWQATTGDPGALDSPAWAFTGQYLLVFGGRLNGTTKLNGAGSYDLSSNSWTAVTAVTGTAVVSARWGAFGVWDGSAFTVWGGRDETSAKNDGQTNSAGHWTLIPYLSGAAPSARWAPYRQTGWAFARTTGDLLIIGGQDINGNCLGDGARVVLGSGLTANSWTPIPRWNVTEDHQWGAAAYIGGALVVWGGRTGTDLSSSGDRWSP